MTQEIIAAGKGITLMGEAANSYVGYLYVKMLIEAGITCALFGSMAYGIYRLIKWVKSCE